MRCLAFLTFAAVSFLPAVALAADFNVTADSTTTSAYTINGQLNSTLNLRRGVSYTFQVTSPGHPFYIKTAAVAGTGDTYDTGVTNNGLTSGTLTFSVPANAPSSLFYQCSLHAAMTGGITITNPVPASDWVATLLLGVGLGAAGLVMIGRQLVRPRGVAKPSRRLDGSYP